LCAPLHLTQCDARDLLPATISPRSASEDPAAILLARAVAQQIQPGRPVDRLSPHQLRAIEDTDVEIQILHTPSLVAENRAMPATSLRNPLSSRWLPDMGSNHDEELARGDRCAGV